MTRHRLCSLEELAVGRLTPAKLGRSEIILWHSKTGDVKAFAGRCPHQGAELKFGCVTDLTSGDDPNQLEVDKAAPILRCPWHGFEFSLQSGNSIVPYNNNKPLRLREFEVVIEDNQVVVVL